MIKKIKYFLVAIILIFLIIFIKKLEDYKNFSNIYALEKKINNLKEINIVLKENIEKIYNNLYVNYDETIENIKDFKNILNILKNDRLIKILGLENLLNNINDKFYYETKIIEKIIEENAIIKSSFLYLFFLKKEIVISNIKDRKVIDTINDILNRFTYEIFSKESSDKEYFKKNIEIIKNYKTSNKKLAKYLEIYVNQSQILFDLTKDSFSLLNEFKNYNKKLSKNLEQINFKIRDYKNYINRQNLIIEIILQVIMLFLIIAIFFLINKEQKIEQKLKRMVEYDFLTGLPNRYKLIKDIKKFKDVYVVRFDIDNFSYINEKYGMSVGDEVLKFLAKVLNSLCPNYAYRASSDEFLVLCKTEKKEDIKIFFNNLKEEIKKSSPYFFTLSGGAYKLSKKNVDIGKLNNYFRSAIFSAKKRGGDYLIFYDNNDLFIKEFEYYSKIG
ncbi:MAG TPA: diguanylate cyclase, partial [Campylobacterales bacterium]|nr:diguanylate cyclase [Campylobacterales bacterium]